MARLILSAGIFSALAAATAVRRRGFPSGSPPALAAIVISLIRRVKILPRFASRAPFLCLIVAHFEWPDMGNLGSCCVFGSRGEMLENKNGLEQFPQTLSIAGATKIGEGAWLRRWRTKAFTYDPFMNSSRHPC